MPLISVVFPAPSSPVRTTTQGGPRRGASARPNAMVSSAECVSTVRVYGARTTMRPIVWVQPKSRRKAASFVETHDSFPRRRARAAERLGQRLEQIGRDERVLALTDAGKIARQSMQIDRSGDCTRTRGSIVVAFAGDFLRQEARHQPR